MLRCSKGTLISPPSRLSVASGKLPKGYAGLAKLAYAMRSKRIVRKDVWVRIPHPAHSSNSRFPRLVFSFRADHPFVEFRDEPLMANRHSSMRRSSRTPRGSRTFFCRRATVARPRLIGDSWPSSFDGLRDPSEGDETPRVSRTAVGQVDGPTITSCANRNAYFLGMVRYDITNA